MRIVLRGRMAGRERRPENRCPGSCGKGNHSTRRGWAKRVYFVGDKKETTDGELLEH
jgi:hypothetical protein